MAKKLNLDLTPFQRSELETAVKEHPKAYIRERASALLQIADGASGRWVAEKGLLIKRRKNTVYDWVHRYKVEGFQGLFTRPGRGRKASFFP